jgi:O-antigen ligase
VDDRARSRGDHEEDRKRSPTSRGKSAAASQAPSFSSSLRLRAEGTPPGARVPFARGLRLSALLLVSVVVSTRPFFAGTPDDFTLTVLLASLLALAFSLTLVSRWPERALPVLWTPLHGPLLLFALATLWGLKLGTWQPEAVLRGLDYLSLLLLALLLAELSLELEERHLLLVPLLGSLFVVVLYGYYQYFWEFDRMLAEMAAQPAHVAQELGISPESWPDFIARVRGREIFSTFLMSNSLGGYLVLLLPVLAGYLFDRLARRRGEWWREPGLWLLAIILGAGAVALSLSRVKGAWIALAGALVLGVPLLVLWSRLRRFWPALVLGVCLVAGLFFWWLWRTDVTSRVLVNDSLGARLGFWQGALQVLGKHPLGVGIGRFQPYYLQDKLPSAHEVDLPHCVWLEVWVELGPLAAGSAWPSTKRLGRPAAPALLPREAPAKPHRPSLTSTSSPWASSRLPW